LVKSWATDHKTIIVFDGGNSNGLSEIAQIIEQSSYPWAEFRESDGCLEELRTAVGVVIPADFHSRYETSLDERLQALLTLLQTGRLAV